MCYGLCFELLFFFNATATTEIYTLSLHDALQICGGANGARIQLSPQKYWEVNNPAELSITLETLMGIQEEFNNAQSDGKSVSLADLIVLGGCAGIEQAAKNAGHEVAVPFSPGRADSSQKQTDVESFAVLEPMSYGFRHRSEERPVGKACKSRGSP